MMRRRISQQEIEVGSTTADLIPEAQIKYISLYLEYATSNCNWKTNMSAIRSCQLGWTGWEPDLFPPVRLLFTIK